MKNFGEDWEREARETVERIRRWAGNRAVAEAKVRQREEEKREQMRRMPAPEFDPAMHVPFSRRKGFPYTSLPWPERLRLAQERWAKLTPEEQQCEAREQQRATAEAIRWIERHIKSDANVEAA